MQLIHLPPYPRPHIPKIYLIPQFPPAHFARPQRVQRSRYDRGRRFLIVEDAEGGHGYDGEEYGEAARPDAPGAGDGWESTVGAAGHEGAGVGSGRGDEGAVGWGVDVLMVRGWAAQAERLVEDRKMSVGEGGAGFEGRHLGVRGRVVWCVVDDCRR